MSEHVESHNQKGGITAHSVNIGTQINVSNHVPIYKRKKIWILTAISLIAAIVTIFNGGFGVFDRFFKKESSIMSSRGHPQEVHNITSYNQSGGITAYKVNVNQQRAILPQAQVKKEKRGDIFVLQLVLTQTSGVWDPSTMFKLQAKTSEPYQTADIKGLPSVQYEVSTIERKEEGLFAYSTRTAPLKDEPIILEIQSANDINLLEFSVEPLAKDK